MPKAKKNEINDGLTVKGFFRLNIINPDGTVAGDSGWRQNQIVNNGYQQFLQFALIGSAGSKTVTHAALGTGTAPASADTTIIGELTETNSRMAITTGTVGSKTVNFTFTLNSGTISAASTIQNVGLFNGSTRNGGTMLAGNTYATSSLATNQSVNGTYQIIFG